MNKDQLKGRGKQAAGKAKEVFGKVVANDRVIAEGRAQQIEGKAQEVLGTAKKGVKHIVSKVKKGR